jgi:hypothetical protein
MENCRGLWIINLRSFYFVNDGVLPKCSRNWKLNRMGLTRAWYAEPHFDLHPLIHPALRHLDSGRDCGCSPKEAGKPSKIKHVAVFQDKDYRLVYLCISENLMRYILNYIWLSWWKRQRFRSVADFIGLAADSGRSWSASHTLETCAVSKLGWTNIRGFWEQEMKQVYLAYVVYHLVCMRTRIHRKWREAGISKSRG